MPGNKPNSLFLSEKQNDENNPDNLVSERKQNI